MISGKINFGEADLLLLGFERAVGGSGRVACIRQVL